MNVSLNVVIEKPNSCLMTIKYMLFKEEKILNFELSV